MRDPLAPFDLERWMREGEEKAKIVIGSSGVHAQPIGRILPWWRPTWSSWWTRPFHEHVHHVAAQIAATYGVDPREVLFTQGASEAGFVTALGLAGPGGHVVIERPAYFSLLEPARSLGCKITRVDRDATKGFRLDPTAVTKAITKDTRLVCLSRPHNPTGERVPDADLVEIAKSAQRVGAYVLVDEVFGDATADAERPARLLHDHLISTNSVTKALGYGPLQLGWIVAAQPALEQIERAKFHVRPTAPALTMGLAGRVLERRSKILEGTRSRRAANVELIRRFTERRRLEWFPPATGTTCVMKLPATHRDDLAFARACLDRHGLLVTPGSYLELPGWIRLGLVGDTKTLQRGLEVLGSTLDEEPPRLEPGT